LDRFLFKIKVDYPGFEEERKILERMSGFIPPEPQKVCSPELILEARKACSLIYMDNKVQEYILRIVFSTRFPEKYFLPELKSIIQVGASPRATLALTRASRAHAFLRHKGFVTPEDVKAVAYDVLRHRIIISFEGEAEGFDSEQVIKKVLDRVEVP